MVSKLFTPADSKHRRAVSYFFYVIFHSKEEKIADLWVCRPLIFLSKCCSLPPLARTFIPHNGSKDLTEQKSGVKQSQRSCSVKHWNHFGQDAGDENNHSWPDQCWSSITRCPKRFPNQWKTSTSLTTPQTTLTLEDCNDCKHGFKELCFF